MCTEFDEYRNKYIENLANGEICMVAAYYYYVNNAPGEDVVDFNSFAILIEKGLSGGINMISQEFVSPVLNYNEIENILSNYYSVQLLYDKENNLVKVF